MKKLCTLIFIIFFSLTLYSCKKNEEDYISLTNIYEECKKYENIFQHMGYPNLVLSNSNLSITGIFGRKYVQGIDSNESILIVEFASNDEAVQAKAYIEEYKNVYNYSVYKNILFLDIFPCHLSLNNCEKQDGIVFSKDYKTLVLFCDGIEYYELPECVENISLYAFTSTDIKEIKFNNNLECVKDFAFMDCIKLKEIFFNDGLEYIGRFVFDGCAILKNIYVPSGVKYVAPNAFNYGDVFIDEEQVPSEWDASFCSPHNDSYFKFFSKYYLNTEWEYDEVTNKFIIK